MKTTTAHSAPQFRVFAVTCALLAGTQTACRPTAPEPAAEGTAATETATLVAETPITGVATTLAVRAHVDGVDFACGPQYTTNGVAWSASELMLYLHDVTIDTGNGAPVAVGLPDSLPWQAQGVALLDFAGADNGCADASSDTNRNLSLAIPEGTTSGELVFRFGVPFAINHADPTTLRGPLTVMAMHWGWRGGYKFVRLEGTNSDDRDLMLHLGSTGCTGPMTAVEACEFGGQIEFRVPWVAGTTSEIALNLAPLMNPALLAGTRCMGTDVGETTNCTDAWTALQSTTNAVWTSR